MKKLFSLRFDVMHDDRSDQVDLTVTLYRDGLSASTTVESLSTAMLLERGLVEASLDAMKASFLQYLEDKRSESSNPLVATAEALRRSVARVAQAKEREMDQVAAAWMAENE